ncbi:MAG: bifunctional oligoribonuclease/PAP phosphatase NrnA [Thermodesulfobacteriota bacterium]
MKEIVEEIGKGKNFLISAHLNPEGDAVGSALGLALGLRKSGKNVTVFLEDPVPAIFNFLPSAEKVLHKVDPTRDYDVQIVVDCGDMDRTGEKFRDFKGRKVLINIDHHSTNTRFGDVNLVNTNACATGEIIYDILNAMSVNITPEIAINIYVAILTDTGSFRYASSTSRAFYIASEMVKRGVKPHEIAKKVYESNPAERVRLLGDVLKTLNVSKDGKMASICITLDMMQRAGATKDIVDGFVNYPRSIEGVKVAILFREDSLNRVKLSFRSKGAVNVADIAKELGGGGHPQAAGCTVDGSMEEVKERVNKITERYLAQG